ncbi:hypothetical protein [Thermosulfuriphilus sp.]
MAERLGLAEKLHLLPPDLDLSLLKSLHYAKASLGLIPQSSIPKLEEALARIHHATFSLGSLEERAIVLVFGLKREQPLLERALKGVFLEKIDLPSEIVGKSGEILQRLEKEIQELKEKLKDIKNKLEEIRQRYGQ